MASKLQQGISILYNMELNDYLMGKCINDLNYKINNLGYLYGTGNKPTKSKKVSLIDVCEDNVSIPLFICGVLGLIIGVIIAIRQISSEGGGFFTILIGGTAIILLYAVIGGVSGAVLGFIIGFLYSLSKKNEMQRKADNLYNDEMREYNSRLTKAENRKQIELKEKQILIRQRDSLIARRKAARNKLTEYYNIMNIDVNYRSLIPIGYMDEFMRLGIANKLGGANGLYYLVRQEMRGDRLQYSLDEISRKLDDIISNQHQIYYEITNMNNKCDQLINQAAKSAEISAKNNQLLNAAVANTSIAAYNSQRIKEELKFQNFMYVYNSL